MSNGFPDLVELFYSDCMDALSSSLSATSFVVGYLIGFILIFMMRRFFPGRLYIERLWAAFKLTLIFFRELTLSNISVLRLVIKPKLNIQPAIFAMPTELKHNWEITLLSSLITLTPGTIVIHVFRRSAYALYSRD